MMSAPAPYPMVQSSAPAPDDHEITTRTPSICVDYLSHNWTDEDVWSSWKAMTKRKNEIANGVRLENASWRTWAKQRGKLKTISPETLNWLKDSDVTWLYGPLHEHVESVPPPRVASTREVFDLADSSSAQTKSILKHRTISEMLTTPGRTASPTVEAPPSLPVSGESSRDVSDSEDGGSHRRLPLMSVNSESAISSTRKKTGGSPPASERLFRNLASGDRHDGIPHAEEKRHISFNQRVDQCIAVDADAEEDEDDDDENDDEDDGEFSDGYDTGSRRTEDASSSDEEMLTMKSSPRTASTFPLTSSSRGSSPGIYDMHTIAKLAPTSLKTSNTYPAPSPQVVDPTGFASNMGNAEMDDARVHLSSTPHDYGYGQDGADGAAQTQYSQWDADDNVHGDFDYFNGPDVSDGYHATSMDTRESVGANERGMDKQGDTHVPSSGLDGKDAAGTGNTASSAPKSILKRRGEQGASDQSNSPRSPSAAFSPPDSQMHASPPHSPNAERGRTQQRISSSASQERVQDAARSSSGSLGRTRTNSNGTASDGSESASSPPMRNTDRRESFRGRSGEGSRAMHDGRAALRSSAAQNASNDIDSDGHQSLDLNSPGIPASPQLGDKDEGSESNDEAKLYGRDRDASKWADSPSRGKSDHTAHAKGKSSRRTEDADAYSNTERDPSSRLSVDLDNLPSTVSSPSSSAQGGPTPLNTPTFALARSRGAKQGRGSQQRSQARPDVPSSSDGGSAGIAEGDESFSREPSSPTMPRRTSATGALVAPSDADKDAGVRVPLAHDYVEEDEGGIVGRAVEIVNTARDLIGALLGTGGDRGRSWREAN